jgi:hypothetical protein
LRRALPEWTDVVLPQVPVSGGRARIVIDAQGEADACCLVDDVTFSPE